MQMILSTLWATRLRRLLELGRIDDEPQFKRNRISNEKERTDMVLEAANYLDEETILKIAVCCTRGSAGHFGKVG